jgi:hypothetical protein
LFRYFREYTAKNSLSSQTNLAAFDQSKIKNILMKINKLTAHQLASKTQQNRGISKELIVTLLINSHPTSLPRK